MKYHWKYHWKICSMTCAEGAAVVKFDEIKAVWPTHPGFDALQALEEAGEYAYEFGGHTEFVRRM